MSGDFEHYGAPGEGDVTLYANASHVLMSIKGRFFGTSHACPGGGACWFDDPGRSYLSQFVVRHVHFPSASESSDR